MKLIYLSTITIPSRLANRIQTMKMAEAFSQICDFKLYVGEKLKSNQGIFDYYGVKNYFEIIELGIPKLKPRSLFYSLRYLKIIKREKPDFIFIREPRLAFFLSFFSDNLVLEIHAIPRNYFLYSPLFRKKTKRIIVITKKLKKFFVGKGIPSSKILIAPDSVDLEKFDIKENKKDCQRKLNLPLDKKIALYTGHLYEWKGVTVLLEAAGKSEIRNLKLLFMFVGGTKKDIANFKNEAGNLNNVIMVGYKPHSEIPYWLKAADVLILPNSAKEDISKYWTSPLKLFEYMASKRPIVASDLPSIKEILQNEKNAILVEPDNPQALAEGIKRVLMDKELADGISEQAFKDVQEYTWYKRAERILDFILTN